MPSIWIQAMWYIFRCLPPIIISFFFISKKESKLFGSHKEIHFISFASDAFHFYLQINKLAFGDDLLYRLRFKPVSILYTLKSAALSMPISVTIIVIIFFYFIFFVLFSCIVVHTLSVKLNLCRYLALGWTIVKIKIS